MVSRRYLNDEVLLLAMLWLGFGREVLLVALIACLMVARQRAADS